MNYSKETLRPLFCILHLSNLQKISLFDVTNKPDVIRGGSKIPTTSKGSL